MKLIEQLISIAKDQVWQADALFCSGRPRFL